MIERVKPAVYFEGMSIIRVKREAGGSRDPKSDEKGNLHILQFLTSDFELYAADLTLTMIEDRVRMPEVGSKRKVVDGSAHA